MWETGSSLPPSVPVFVLGLSIKALLFSGGPECSALLIFLSENKLPYCPPPLGHSSHSVIRMMITPWDGQALGGLQAQCLAQGSVVSSPAEGRSPTSLDLVQWIETGLWA